MRNIVPSFYRYFGRYCPGSPIAHKTFLRGLVEAKTVGAKRG
ncbi:MAG TPA: hypothetical protein ACFYD1_06965 [Candidatus Hypogeohydataceae bacterium YC38]